MNKNTEFMTEYSIQDIETMVNEKSFQLEQGYVDNFPGNLLNLDDSYVSIDGENNIDITLYAWYSKDSHVSYIITFKNTVMIFRWMHEAYPVYMYLSKVKYA